MLAESAFMDFLSEIAERRRKKVFGLKKRFPLSTLKAIAKQTPTPRSLERQIQIAHKKGIRPIIAEYKRGSPSRGIIALHRSPEHRAREYLKGGAVAVSILTEPAYFLGSVEDLLLIRSALPRAVLLYKDFIVDPYQIWEARLWGADAVLLIVDLLGRELNRFLRISWEAELEPLVEVYSEKELDIALETTAKLIGVNARNLRNLKTSQHHVTRLLKEIPKDRIAVAESGIHSREDLLLLERSGARAFLVGEHLMKSEDPCATLRDWIH